MALPSLEESLALVRRRRRECIEALSSFTPELDERIAQAGTLLRTALASGKRVYAFGNGGSASDAEHFIAELVGRYLKERPGLPGQAFTVNSSTMTAVGNDYGYERVFERQVEAWVQPGDVVIGISTSGNSPNVLRGIEAARSRDARVIGLTGGQGGKMAALCEVSLIVPSKDTPRIQEGHILILHTLAELVDQA
ncbi:D-sedoheptulose-7-phosphate isomerase [Hyalangium gracile]|uniref:D-sedoheptulose-7-phosphate isomerase n=1 Tax=Hyalangium gracile TaxID=394092 RepID=UPI001CCFCDCA|nr:D-sedoheptulose 7-phosphate isomerase [Hyalangium gracile]